MRVARALADAFLTAAWERGPLLNAGAAVLGVRRRWLGPVVAAVLDAYREAPLDRPRELAGFLVALRRDRSVVFRSDLEPVGPRRAVIVTRTAVATRTVRMRWDTPRIDDLGTLASFLSLDGPDLDWFADRREINRHARDERLRHYRYTWLPHRLIEAPKPRLRALQRLLLDDVLGRLPVHPNVHGFVPGRSVHTFVAPHVGKPVVVSLDLTSFFTSVTAGRVYGLFRTAGYPEPVAHTLTALTTTRTPARVLRHAPDRTRAALLRQPHLPQGAPSSPVLANLTAFRLDRRLTALATRFGLDYSRYADDLAFSGGLGASAAQRFVRHVEAVVTSEGFRAHPAKTHIRGQGDRQRLGGLVVNAHPAVAREEYDRLRAVLHDAATRGLAAANRDNHPHFAAHLAGRVEWVSYRHPTRAAKLRPLLAAALVATGPPEQPG